jgi:hypothetical protein
MRQIFSINPGRSGSHYLFKLFEHAVNVCANHEPEPKMQGREMSQWNQGDEKPLRDLVTIRLAQIAKAHAEGRVWFSANNAFIKGYGYILMEHFAQEETGIVVLKRDAQKVAGSIVRNDWSVAHDSNYNDNAWLLWPGLKRNLTPPPPSKDPLELALWYVREVEARGQRFMEEFPKITYYTVSVDALNTLQKCQEMFDVFGLKSKDSLRNVVGVPTNKGK